MKKTILPLFLFSGMILMLFSTGCLTNAPQIITHDSPRPGLETGIYLWMDAVNKKDVPSIYNLSPSFIRNNITEDEFIRRNENNPLLKPGATIHLDEILDKAEEGENVTISARMVVNYPETETSPATYIPVFMKFLLVFEDNEWKIWIVPYFQ